MTRLTLHPQGMLLVLGPIEAQELSAGGQNCAYSLLEDEERHEHIKVTLIPEKALQVPHSPLPATSPP